MEKDHLELDMQELETMVTPGWGGGAVSAAVSFLSVASALSVIT